MSGLSRLHVRMQLVAVAANVASFLVLVLLAPGVLLLEPDVATAALVETAWTLPTILVLAALATFVRMHRFDPTVRALEAGDGDAPGVDAKLAHRIHALPLWWALQLGAQAIAVGGLTIVPQLRPSIIDVNTQIAIVLLNVTVTAATSLPLYVVARALAGNALEAMPLRVTEEAMRPGQLGRVEGRLLYAVALPVAIVAFGSSLLADAHVRAYETRSRRDNAYALARGVLEPEGSAGTAGRAAAMQVAEQLGYQVTITADDPTSGEPGGNVATPGEGGVRTLRTRLEDGTAFVKFQPTSGKSPIHAYAIAAGLGIALAAVLGRSVGRAVSRDLTSAARQVRVLGTLDVLRGATRVAGPARFEEVAALGAGVEQVAERFREFARGRERMIDARESAQRMRDLFLASMSHDLRSPLNGILGFVALLQKQPLTEAQMESLAIIDRRGRELLELIANILDAARTEAGRLELARDWVAPSDILAQAVRRGRELAEEKQGGAGVDVIGELQPGLDRIFVDGPRLTQAVINLVANAVKFVDHGVVRIRISSTTLERWGSHRSALRIEVEDQGRGIPEKELAQIFDAFRQPLRSRRHGGLGLGLALTRALVDLHGGTLDVTSTPEHGSVFTVWIPMASPGDEGHAASIAPLRGRSPPPFSASASPDRRARRPKDEQEFPTLEMPALEAARPPPRK